MAKLLELAGDLTPPPPIAMVEVSPTIMEILVKRSRNDEKERMLFEATLMKALMIEVLGVLIRKDVFPSDEFMPCFEKAMVSSVSEWKKLPSGITQEGLLQGILDALAIVRAGTDG